MRAPKWDTSPEATIDPIDKYYPVGCYEFHPNHKMKQQDLPNGSDPPVSPGLSDYNTFYVGEEFALAAQPGWIPG